MIAILILILVYFGLRSKKWHKFTVASLWWLTFSVMFPRYIKKERMMKHWWLSIPLMLVSPLFLSFYLLILMLIVFCGMVSRNETYEAPATNYHTAYDIQKATGIVFPEVIPVDSVQHVDYCNNYTRVRFVPKKPLTARFFKRLDVACQENIVCWRKESNAYEYIIYPVDNLDRTKKNISPYRMVDANNDGEKDSYDWEGNYVKVIVPKKGDTITVEEGWIR